MKLLAVLQNQWFHDPARVREILARRPELRRQFCHRALFAGCKTGQVLKSVFGPLCREIVWENASPQIGDFAASKFPADHLHLRAVLDEVKPDIVLAFGRIAGNALTALVPAEKLIIGPHPTARGADVLPRLREIRARLPL